ncbi:hypothetical protein TTHERM_00572110 (macronuclear) [Tetrahymena thermophila SB210]|uniref:Uncharacterized protein n=1 Tax=Tetrahymena thermophila (strain SB210) TaxID=312017 RepID=Q24HW3_TETTS|nr:hypothetical protein TTHERM_00572110 [Tetrahymena thermophila SB210]EAS07475.2 hypothetical protein TTHERM_00572110 [Tetrahymena thermophila SB210]|eukprot:XP_001027717.2 hypothetical protein TTHERM_00572110 [Tetrahymena thermophila SB210]
MSEYQDKLVNRLVSATSSQNKSQDDEQQQKFQRRSQRYLSKVTQQKIEVFNNLTEQFLQGKRVPELSEFQKELIRQQQVDSIKDASDLRRVIVSQKNEQQRNQIQNYQNKYKIKQEKQKYQQLVKKIEVDEKTKQWSEEQQKKLDLKSKLHQERLQQELLEKEAKANIPGIKDMFFKQFIKDTQEKSQPPSRNSVIDDNEQQNDQLIELNYLDELKQNKQDEQQASIKKKTTSVNQKFNDYQMQMQGDDYVGHQMRNKSMSSGNMPQFNVQSKLYQQKYLGEGVVNKDFHINNEKIKKQFYNLNRFNQFQKDIEKKLKQEQEKLAIQKKIKTEMENQTNNFLLTKDMWEKIIDADKNNQPFRLPNFGIEKTPVYKMQQNNEEEKRKIIEKKQRIKQGVFISPKKTFINFKNIYKGVKDIKKYTTLYNTTEYSQNRLLETSLKNSVNSARLIWGSNFLKPTTSPNNKENNLIKSYQQPIQEEPDFNGDELVQQNDYDLQATNQNIQIDKDSLMNKSESAYLPQLVQSNQQAYSTQYESSKYKDTNDYFYSNLSTKEKEQYEQQEIPKRYVYTKSHQKIKLY